MGLRQCHGINAYDVEAKSCPDMRGKKKNGDTVAFNEENAEVCGRKASLDSHVPQIRILRNLQQGESLSWTLCPSGIGIILDKPKAAHQEGPDEER